LNSTRPIKGERMPRPERPSSASLHHLSDELHRRACLVDLHDRLRGLDHGLDDAAGQQHEGDNGANIHRVLVDERQVDRDGDDAICHQYLKRMHNRLHPIRQEPLGIALFGNIGAMHIPLVALPRIQRQRLHRPNAVDRLDEERAAPRLGRRNGPDTPPDRRQHRDEPAADQQGQHQNADCHYRAEEEHDGQEEHDDERVQRRAEQLRRQKTADLPHLMEVVDEFAGRAPLEIVDRQIEDLVEGVAPQLDIGTGRDEQHEIAAEVAESRLEQQDDPESDANHRKGVDAAVIHDAVDEDAPEHDWRDRGNAQDDRADAEVARHAAVAQQ
jgi:hypothetical protein